MSTLIPTTPLLVAVTDLQNGVREIPGGAHHNRIVKSLRYVRYAVAPRDETHHCASMVCLWLFEGGAIDPPRTARSRDLLDYGREVPLRDARPGDLVILWRGERDDGTTGHAGLLMDLGNALGFELIGANQRERAADRVSVKPYLRDRLLGVRRYDIDGDPREWARTA